jgi:hypothetical protein
LGARRPRVRKASTRFTTKDADTLKCAPGFGGGAPGAGRVTCDLPVGASEEVVDVSCEPQAENHH